MAKYGPLGLYLSAQRYDDVLLTFGEVEKIIYGTLPLSARQRRQWWGNDALHVQSKAWKTAGYRVEAVSLAREWVHFQKL